jgi:putative methyltransferase (TIGR04325 family)
MGEIMSKDFNIIWDGIYADFSEAPKDVGVFDSSLWVDKQANCIVEMRKGGRTTSMTKAYALTPIIATMVDGGNTVRVLDFGGSLGTEYLAAKDSITIKDSIDFTIVENAAICERGNALFADDGAIRFVSDMPDTHDAFDIVHAGSSLQYVDDWQGLLKTFTEFRPYYIVLSDVLAGDNPSFVTVQRYYGRRIAVRFLNKLELTRYMEEIGYKLVLCQQYVAKPNVDGKPLSMANFPQNYRIDFTTNLLFKRL